MIKKIIILFGIILNTPCIDNNQKKEEMDKNKIIESKDEKDIKNIFKITAKTSSTIVFSSDIELNDETIHNGAIELYDYCQNNNSWHLLSYNGTPFNNCSNESCNNMIEIFKEGMREKAHSLIQQVKEHNEKNPNDQINSPKQLYEKLCQVYKLN